MHLKKLLSSLFLTQPIETPAKDPVANQIQSAVEKNVQSTQRLERAVYDFLAENERLRKQRQR